MASSSDFLVGGNVITTRGGLCFSIWGIHTLPETNIAPENRPSQKETIVFQLSICRGYVCFREGINREYVRFWGKSWWWVGKITHTKFYHPFLSHVWVPGMKKGCVTFPQFLHLTKRPLLIYSWLIKAIVIAELIALGATSMIYVYIYKKNIDATILYIIYTHTDSFMTTLLTMQLKTIMLLMIIRMLLLMLLLLLLLVLMMMVMMIVIKMIVIMMMNMIMNMIIDIIDTMLHVAPNPFQYNLWLSIPTSPVDSPYLLFDANDLP